jgi:hypothetical protein
MKKLIKVKKALLVNKEDGTVKYGIKYLKDRMKSLNYKVEYDKEVDMDVNYNQMFTIAIKNYVN